MALADQKRVFRSQMEKLEQERRRFEVRSSKRKVCSWGLIRSGREGEVSGGTETGRRR